MISDEMRKKRVLKFVSEITENLFSVQGGYVLLA